MLISWDNVVGFSKDSMLAPIYCNNMHDSFADIKMEHHYSVHQDHDFGGGYVLDIAEDHSPHHSPPNDYDDFVFSAATHVQMGPIYNRPMQPAFPSPQPLQSLVTMAQWPSQITNPSEHSSPPAPIPLHRPILPLSKTTPVPTLTPAPAPSKLSHPTSTSRRTLTDSDRRRMCEYHSENPNVKQTEIGGEIGIPLHLRGTR